MKVYWRHRRRGQNLVLSDENEENEEEIGGFRETKRGIDAYAKTFTYDPGRSQKGFPTIEDAKAFVEYFKPWELFDGTQDLTVETEVRPAIDSSSTATPSTSDQPTAIAAPDLPADNAVPAPQPESVVSEPEPQPEPGAGGLQPKKRWWEFWKDS
jgi:hypothetical protein